MGVYNYGSAPTYVKVASFTATTTTASYTFTNIPQNYTDLILVTSGIGSGTENLECYINGDTGNNYSFTYLYGDGSSVASGRNANTNRIVVGRLGTGTSHGIAHFQNYSNSLINKTIITRKGKGSEIGMIFSNIWRNNSPITSLQIFGAGGQTMSSGYTATIYGVKAALVPKATGGDIIVQDGTYWYHAFRTTGAFVPIQSLTADVLQVAGGGAGGSRAGGGGGAGGVLGFASQSLTSGTSYTCTVGAGGAKVSSLPSVRGNTGNNSQFASLTASVGGGGGGVYPGTALLVATTGGSGGGGGSILGSTSGLGAAGTSGQGNAGGNGASGSYSGGGGGGAGGAGSNSSGSGGAGGAGTNSVTNWNSLTAVLASTGLGVSGYIAGGGGGTTDGTGGSGGGGAGSDGSTGSASNAAAATGSGGGGARNAPDTYGVYSGSGGSGLVIVRYSV